MTMKACSHKHGCSGNYLLAWDVALAQMSAVISSISLASHSPRSVHIVHFFVMEQGPCRQMHYCDYTGVKLHFLEFCKSLVTDQKDKSKFDHLRCSPSSPEVFFLICFGGSFLATLATSRSTKCQ